MNVRPGKRNAPAIPDIGLAENTILILAMNGQRLKIVQRTTLARTVAVLRDAATNALWVTTSARVLPAAPAETTVLTHVPGGAATTSATASVTSAETENAIPTAEKRKPTARKIAEPINRLSILLVPAPFLARDRQR
jgi:hypothetical protein